MRETVFVYSFLRVQSVRQVLACELVYGCLSRYSNKFDQFINFLGIAHIRGLSY